MLSAYNDENIVGIIATNQITSDIKFIFLEKTAKQSKNINLKKIQLSTSWYCQYQFITPKINS